MHAHAHTQSQSHTHTQEVDGYSVCSDKMYYIYCLITRLNSVFCFITLYFSWKTLTANIIFVQAVFCCLTSHVPTTHTHTHTHTHTDTHGQIEGRGKADYTVTGEGVTNCAAREPFSMVCHHMVTKCAGSASTLTRFVLVTKHARVTRCATTGLSLVRLILCTDSGHMGKVPTHRSQRVHPCGLPCVYSVKQMWHRLYHTHHTHRVQDQCGPSCEISEQMMWHTFYCKYHKHRVCGPSGSSDALSRY